MSDFFKDLGETISKTAQGISEKAGSVYESQKLRNKIATEERMIQKAMEEIGKWVYSKYTDGEEIDEEIISFCEEIRDHQEQIEVYKEEAANRKGKKICPSCKKAVDRSVSFCPFCGTPVPDPEPQEAPEEAFENAELFEDDETSKSSAEEAKEEACEAADKAEEAAADVAEEAKEAACEAADAAEEVKEAACEAAENAAEEVKEAACKAAETAEEACETAGECLKNAAEDIKDILE